MVKVKKKKKCTNFKSIDGQNLELYINERQFCLNITILNSYNSVHKKVIVLLIISSVNLLCLIFNVISLTISAAIFLISLLMLLKFCRTLREENLVIVHGLGFQLTVNYLLGSKTIFIPQEQVQTVFINEVIFRNRVIYLLTLLIRDKHTKEKLVPIFQEALPRLACLKVVYNSIKKLEVTDYKFDKVNMGSQ